MPRIHPVKSFLRDGVNGSSHSKKVIVELFKLRAFGKIISDLWKNFREAREKRNIQDKQQRKVSEDRGDPSVNKGYSRHTNQLYRNPKKGYTKAAQSEEDLAAVQITSTPV